MPDGKIAKWHHIEALHHLQLDEKLSCANKLTERHINFWQQKMNVSLAALTISASVADALEFARKRLQLEDFKDSEGTEIFLRTINRQVIRYVEHQ